jgi:hypothetical protein
MGFVCEFLVFIRRPRKDHRGVDLISDVLPFGRLWYDTPDHATGYAMHSSRSHDAVIRVYDAAGDVIETHEHRGECSSLESAVASLVHFLLSLCFRYFRAASSSLTDLYN